MVKVPIIAIKFRINLIFRWLIRSQNNHYFQHKSMLNLKIAVKCNLVYGLMLVPRSSNNRNSTMNTTWYNHSVLSSWWLMKEQQVSSRTIIILFHQINSHLNGHKSSLSFPNNRRNTITTETTIITLINWIIIMVKWLAFRIMFWILIIISII